MGIGDICFVEPAYLSPYTKITQRYVRSFDL